MKTVGGPVTMKLFAAKRQSSRRDLVNLGHAQPGPSARERRNAPYAIFVILEVIRCNNCPQLDVEKSKSILLEMQIINDHRREKPTPGHFRRRHSLNFFSFYRIEPHNKHVAHAVALLIIYIN